jgi:very-short-patch-repair endonuclease
MDSVRAMVASLGGLAQKRQLVALGAHDRMLAAAVRSGSVIRARQGWYSTFADHDAALRAARVGGRLTGMSTLIALGAWSWIDHPLHVSVPRRASRLREQWNRFRRLDPAAARDVVIHWDDDAVVAGGDATSVSLADALHSVVLDEPFEIAIAAFDWAFKSGSIDRMAFEEILLSLPDDARMIAHWVDQRCDSILESVARTWLQLAGYRVVSQVRVGDVERIDIVVEGDVALELGGRTHDATREADWRKNVKITAEGRHPILATYSMVREEFASIVAAIESALERRHPGRHPGRHSHRPLVGNSGIHVGTAPLGRRVWRLLDGSTTRIPEFPTRGMGAARE